MKELKAFKKEPVDVFVIGAGHAGCEAALASARLGKKTVLSSISLESVADMPCNPNVGGTGKGHLVREIDALGGQMALTIDETFLQSRMLNLSKGSAIHSLRVQADKRRYHEEMKRVIEREKNLSLVEAEVKRIDHDDQRICGVETVQGAYYPCKCVIVCTGTFLNGQILMGELTYSSGPHGQKPSLYLTESLREMGLPLMRFKTGTPPRVNKRSIDYSKTLIQKGDDRIIPFSFLNQDKVFDAEKQVPCYLTHTNQRTREIIEENLTRATMYSGEDHGVGPRYCPSIEDKMVRFPDHEHHQIFLEPEGASTDEIYVDGLSSTLPLEIQEMYVRTVPGLEKAEIMRPAYGIEYDCIDARALKRSLEYMGLTGLFFAGQINGSSGYEEAAGQGLMAGINAALLIDGKEPFILDRSQAYIGVLIDDLVTKGTNEPYRMMTSRCEYRLSLRQDNADLRLTELAHKIGLVSPQRYELMVHKKDLLKKERARLSGLQVNPTEKMNQWLEDQGSAPLKKGQSLAELLKRPELSYESLAALDPGRPYLPREIQFELETEIKYEGYIKKEEMKIEKFKKLEARKLDIDDYSKIFGLKKEAIQKLNQIKPESVGQASRISGVSPADINVLLIYLEQARRAKSGR